MMDFPHATESGIIVDRDDGDMPAQVNATLSPLYPEFVTCWRVCTHDDGGAMEYALCFVYETASYAEYFTSGWFDSLEQAIGFFAELLKDDNMNIFKNDRLFPRIKGVMLKDKPVTLTLSGKVNIVELKDGDARAELFFTDHTKTATVNANQLSIIAALYGPETDAWAGKRVELYGEFGKWFGKETWGIRVSNKVPPAPRKNGMNEGERAVKASREADAIIYEAIMAPDQPTLLTPATGYEEN